jgi:hypothetical protein
VDLVRKRITAPFSGAGHAPERAILPRARTDANAAPAQTGTRTADSHPPNARTVVRPERRLINFKHAW